MPQQPPFQELSDDELEKLLNPPNNFNELDEGIMHRAWRIANTPLTNLPSRAMGAIADIPQSDFNERLAQSVGLERPFHAVQDYSRAGLRATGSLMDELTTPLNIATMGTGAAENIAGRYGLKGAELGLNLATKALSAPVAVEGAHKIYSEPTLGGKAMGALEMGGGALGMMHGPFGFKVAKEAAPAAEAGAEAIARPTGLTDFINGLSPEDAKAARETVLNRAAGEVTPPTEITPPTEPGIPTKRNLKIQPDGNFLDKDTGELFNSKGEKVGETKIHRTAETGQFRKKMSYDPKTGTYLDKTTGDVYNAQGEKIGSTKPPVEVAPLPTRPIPTLPSDLAGAKPRYNRGLDVYHPQFANDIDKALYIIAQAKGSKRDADYMAWLVENTGLDETMLRGLAQEFKDHVKGILRYEKPGNIDIPSLHDPQSLLKGKVKGVEALPTPSTAAGGLGQAPTTATLRKAGEDYEIIQNGQVVGKIYKSWFRNGGEGWTHNGMQGHKTLQDALKDFTRRQAREKPPTATGGGQPPMPPGVSPTGLPPAGSPKPPPIPEAVPAGTVLKPPPPKPPQVASKFSEVFNLAKGLMSWDYPFVTSAAFRQGSYHAFSKKWFLGWKNAARAYGEQAAYDEINAGIENMRSFKRTLEPMRTATGKLVRDPITGEIKTKIIPSLADRIGLDLPDLKSLKTREEMIGSQLAEKAPLIGGLIKRSNRAYTAFLNTVRAHALEQIRDGLMAKGIDIEKDIPTGKLVADMINTTTGRAPLKLTVGVPFSEKYSKEISWEKGADVLNGLMFSPRNYMSSVRMLDPLTYTNAPKHIRALYVKAMLRKASAWSAMTMLGSMVGGSVNLNPTNSDFMKVRFGNKRIDPGGGLQQFLVLLARTAPFIGANGMSTTDRFGRDVFHKFGQGYKPETQLTTAFHFAVNHAHPVLGTIAGMFDATEHRPVYPLDDVIKKMVPMFSADVLDVVNEDPSMEGLIQGLAMGTVSSLGMGAQTYDRQSTPSFSAIPGGQYHYPLKRRER